MPKLTKDQTDALKAKHGTVFELVATDKDGSNPKYAYLKKPDRKLVSYCASIQRDIIKSNEAMLNGCWIEGDDEIKTDNDYFLNVQGQLGSLIEEKVVELKKL
jgi:hypothetical protein